MKAIDISNNNTINIKEVLKYNADITHIFMKLSEGVGYKDSKVNSFVSQIPNNIIRGFYHFARPDLGNTPEEEFNYFKSLLSAQKITNKDVIILDYEVQYSKGASYIENFMTLIEKNYPHNQSLVYVNESTAEDLMLSKYPLWIANYGTNSGRAEKDFEPSKKTYKKIYAWQYTSLGKLNSHPDYIDLSIVYGLEESDVVNFFSVEYEIVGDYTPSSPYTKLYGGSSNHPTYIINMTSKGAKYNEGKGIKVFADEKMTQFIRYSDKNILTKYHGRITKGEYTYLIHKLVDGSGYVYYKKEKK